MRTSTMVAPRPILKSFPFYTPDMMKHTRTTRFDGFDSDPNADDNDNSNEDEGDYEQGQAPDPITPPSPALPFASTAHIPPFSPHVHFPPTPTLVQMAMTHSSMSYDRKPIKVQPNELALPARGEREVESESDAESETGSDTESEARISAGSGPGAHKDSMTRKTLENGDAENDQGYFNLPTRSYDAEVVDSMDIDAEQDIEQALEERSCSFGTNSPRNSGSRSSSRRGSPKASVSKARPQTPYHPSSPSTSSIHHSCFGAFLPPPPPLVFDPSSESDSDLCSPTSGQSPDQVSHMSQVSLHLAALSAKLPLDHDRAFVPTRTPVSSSLFTRKRAEDRHLSPRSTHGSGVAKRHKICGGKHAARIVGGPDAGYRTNMSSTSSESRFSSGFFEGGLDGCLGGF